MRQALLLVAAPMLSAAFTPPPLESAAARSSNQPYTAVLVVPTGVGAAIGGYAGDAMPVARAFSAVADRVVTHPNVMNGAQLYWPDSKLQYTEGFALDEFAAGRWGLRPVSSIGFEASMEARKPLSLASLHRSVPPTRCGRSLPSVLA